MTDLKDSRTIQNLRAAFAREAAAHRRYLYFAKIAELEGLSEVARTFRELAEALEGHADGHMDFLKIAGDPITGQPIGDTEDNLAASLFGEMSNVEAYYPEIAEVARQEGFDQIASWFETMVRAKRAHADRLRIQLKSVDG